MSKNHYNELMSNNKFDDYVSDAEDLNNFLKKVSTFSRQEITDLMHEIYLDTEFLMDSYAPPKLIRYYHELLSRLVKTYGH
tara:strand:- start:254 stop:496 length:243 start_codon:yes stop_codon:yes gene_type:complete